MKIYVASSWRNKHLQQGVVHTLRAAGHDVYDFMHPAREQHGFSWSQIDPAWQSWTPQQWREALKHPVAEEGFAFDRNALDWCECGVLVLPCGRSAHLELGYLAGQRKPCAVLALENTEPELMVKLCSGGVLTSFAELLNWTGTPATEVQG
jgi:hypothetical protein